MVRNNSASNKALIATELFNSINSSLQQSNISRYLLARSENFEKQTAELLQSLSAYARRTAKLRDSGDIVSEAFNSISIGEVLNPSLKRSLAELAKSYRCIQDHRDSEVLFLEEKLLRNVAEYGEKLQKQREELRSNIARVFDGRNRGSSWIKSANSNRRQRSQSLERSNRPSKEEKALHQAIQRYELRRNLILKKLILKFISSELRFTVRSLNNLTYSYQTVARHLNPSEDLQLFNDFFDFRPINKMSLNKVKDDVESDDEEGDNNEEPDETSDASYDSNNDSDKDVENLEHDDGKDDDEEQDDDEEEEEDDDEEDSDSNGNNTDNPTNRVPVHSALKRFNSTPEISSSPSASNLKRSETGDKSDQLSSSKENLNNQIFKKDQSKDGQLRNLLIKNKLNFKSTKSSNKKSKKKKDANKKESEVSGTEEEEEEDGEDDDSKEYQSEGKSKNDNSSSKNNKKNGSTIKLFKNRTK